MPAKRTRRRLLLDQVAQAFEPGRKYSEAAVDEILKTIFDDHCALRRYLVDEAVHVPDRGRRLLAGRRHRQLARPPSRRHRFGRHPAQSPPGSGADPSKVIA